MISRFSNGHYQPSVKWRSLKGRTYKLSLSREEGEVEYVMVVYRKADGREVRRTLNIDGPTARTVIAAAA